MLLILALLTEVKTIGLNQYKKSVTEEGVHMGHTNEVSEKVGKWFNKRLPAGLETLHNVGASIILPAIAVLLA